MYDILPYECVYAKLLQTIRSVYIATKNVYLIIFPMVCCLHFGKANYRSTDLVMCRSDVHCVFNIECTTFHAFFIDSVPHIFTTFFPEKNIWRQWVDIKPSDSTAYIIISWIEQYVIPLSAITVSSKLVDIIVEIYQVTYYGSLSRIARINTSMKEVVCSCSYTFGRDFISYL